MGIDDMSKFEQPKTQQEERDPHRALRESIEGQQLPVHERFEEIVEGMVRAYKNGTPFALEGETGSGKSVYAPLIVREALRRLSLPNRIVGMQPRRDATQNVTESVAALLHTDVGGAVGYSTGETKKVGHDAEIHVMTAGIFKRWAFEGNLTKENVGAIIIDEVHERSIDVEFTLARVKQMREWGEAPLVVFVSATMNKEELQAFFAIPDEAYMRVEGRRYPVETSYTEEKTKDEGREYLTKTVDIAKEVLADGGTGDILVFLPGMREIDDVARMLGGDVLIYHGSLEFGERRRILDTLNKKPTGRRVILATNVAETSITFPHITAVVDSGMRRIMHYNPKTGVQEPKTVPVSQAEADQRKGRAGRVQNGVCRRVYSEEQFAGFSPHVVPEIEHVNIVTELLFLKYYGIDPLTFPFVHAPTREAIEHGLSQLRQFGALDEKGDITDIGNQMAEFPFDAPVARMVVEGKRQGRFLEAFTLAVLLRENDGAGFFNGVQGGQRMEAWEKREKMKAIQEKQAVFNRGGSDVLRLLTVFASAIEHGAQHVGRGKGDLSIQERTAVDGFYEWCREHHLNPQALAHATKVLRRTQEEYNRKKKEKERVTVAWDTLPQQLLDVPDDEIGAILTATYAKSILYQSASGRGMPDYAFVDGPSMAVNIVPNSVCFESAPSVFATIRGVRQGKGSARGRETIRNYAHLNHPISLEQMRRALPDLLTVQHGYVEYDGVKDTVVREDTYFVKRACLGKEKEIIHGKEAVPVFARALAQGAVEGFPYDAKNKETARHLLRYYTKTGGQVASPSLEAWYVEHLGTASSFSEAQNLGEALLFKEEDFLSQEQKMEYDRTFPDTVSFGDVLCDVWYTYNPTSYYPAEKYVARVVLPTEQLFTIPEHADKDFSIGTSAIRPRIVFQSEWGGRVYEEESLGALQEKKDAYQIQQAWRTTEPTLSKQTLQEDVVLQSMPDLGALGFNKIEYTKDRAGKSVYACPAVYATQTKRDTEGVAWDFSIRYFDTEDEARTAQQYAEESRSAMLQEGDRKKAVEQLLAPTKTRFETMQKDIQALKDHGAEFGLTAEEKAAVRVAENEVNTALQGYTVDYYGYRSSSVPIDPRKALAPLEVLAQFIARKERYEKEKETLRTEVQTMFNALRDTLMPIWRDDRYASGAWARRGFQNEETFKTVMRLWGDIDYALLHEGNMVEARSNMLQVQEIMQDTNAEAWSTPEARRYQELLGSRYRGVFARLRVQQGKVLELVGEYGETPVWQEVQDTIKIGQSGRSATVRRLGAKVVLQPYSGAGNPFGSPVTLPEGDFDIFRDMDSIWEVKRDDKNTVVGVVRELDRYGGDGVEDTLNQDVYRQPQQYREPETFTVASSGDGGKGTSLGDILRAQQEGGKATIPTKVEIVRQNMQQRVQETREVPLSTERRMEITMQLTALRTVLSILHAWWREYAPENTPEKVLIAREREKRQKVLDRIKDKNPELVREVQDVVDLLERTPDGADTTVVENKARACTSHVYALSKQSTFGLFEGGVTQEWAEDFIHVVDTLQSSIMKHADAREFLDEGLVTREQLVTLVQESVAKKMQGVRGVVPNVQECITEVLGTI